MGNEFSGLGLVGLITFLEQVSVESIWPEKFSGERCPSDAKLVFFNLLLRSLLMCYFRPIRMIKKRLLLECQLDPIRRWNLSSGEAPT